MYIKFIPFNFYYCTHFWGIVSLFAFFIIINKSKAQYPVLVSDSLVGKEQLILFPIRGEGKISEMGGYGNFFKTLEVWVYDFNGKQIYYNMQSIPVNEAFSDIVNKMIDRQYTLLMMKHGQVMNSRRTGAYAADKY
jgi:hypothetical protein